MHTKPVFTIIYDVFDKKLTSRDDNINSIVLYLSPAYTDLDDCVRLHCSLGASTPSIR